MISLSEQCCKPGVTLNYLHSISKEAFAVELKGMRLKG